MSSCVVDGARLAFTVEGPTDAPVLVLSNSLGTNLHMWDPQHEALSRHMRLVRYDSRGHGRSDARAGDHTIDQLGRDLVALLDALGVERASVCGLSLGGVVAQWVAIHYPERVERAVFANTAARIGSPESWQTRIEAVRAGGMRAISDTVVARFLAEGFRQTHPETAQGIRDMLEETSPEGYIGSCAALRDADLRGQIASIEMPSLVVVGALDEATPPEQGRELQQSIAGAECVVLRGASHLSNIEQPEAFTACVLDFLTR